VTIRVVAGGVPVTESSTALLASSRMSYRVTPRLSDDGAQLSVALVWPMPDTVGPLMTRRMSLAANDSHPLIACEGTRSCPPLCRRNSG
jgi:hypothetical protein